MKYAVIPSSAIARHGRLDATYYLDRVGAAERAMKRARESLQQAERRVAKAADLVRQAREFERALAEELSHLRPPPGEPHRVDGEEPVDEKA
jgi:small-conductance mechanosensitive channel